MVTGAVRRQQPFRGLRPFNPVRDLGEVAELLRLAFADELGRPEATWLGDVEPLGVLKPFVWFVNRLNLAMGGPSYGFVWVEDGRIVGNVTIGRLSSQNWLISNVAVHPNYRRRGIARDLMDASVDWIRERGARWVTLEVRRDNVPAKSLYLNMGFVVVQGTTEMERHGVGSITRVPPPAGYQLRLARPADGTQMFELARQTTPELAQVIDPIRRHDYESGTLDHLLEGLRRLIGLPATLRWVVTDADKQVVAMLKVRRGGYHHWLHLLIHPNLHGMLEEALATRALDALSGHRGTVHAKVDADHPAAMAVLKSYGFREIRTLDRMALELNRPRRIPVKKKNRKDSENDHKRRPRCC